MNYIYVKSGAWIVLFHEKRCNSIWDVNCQYFTIILTKFIEIAQYKS